MNNKELIKVCKRQLKISAKIKKDLNKSPFTLNISLGSLIWSIRLCSGKSQEKFAKELCVSSSFLSDLEDEIVFIVPSTAKYLAKKLGYPPEQFVELCLQDMLNREGIKMKVTVCSNKRIKA